MRGGGGARAAVIFLTTALLLAAGCSAKATYKPPFVPVELAVSVDSNGNVAVHASASDKVVTPVGTFGVGGGVSQAVIDKTSGFVVTFRSGTTDTIFRIDSGDSLHLEVDGHLVEDVTAHSAVITVSAGTAYTIKITDPPGPTPTQVVDAGCKGDAHRKALPYINAGATGTQTLPQVVDILHALCLTVDIVPEKQDDCVKFMVGLSWVACDLNTVDKIEIPFDREHFIWWDWSSQYLTYNRTTTASFPCGGVYADCQQTTWGWAKDSAGKQWNTGDVLTVYSSRAARVTVASIPLVPMQYSDGTWHPWPPGSDKAKKTFTPQTTPPTWQPSTQPTQ